MQTDEFNADGFCKLLLVSLRIGISDELPVIRTTGPGAIPMKHPQSWREFISVFGPSFVILRVAEIRGKNRAGKYDP